MDKRKLKPIPFSRFYDSVSQSHKALLLEEADVLALIEDNQSFFTKVDTLFDTEEVSITRMVEPILRGDGDYLARELLIAMLHKDIKHKYLVAFTPIRFDGKSPLPDKQVRFALLSSMKENWGLKFGK